MTDSGTTAHNFFSDLFEQVTVTEGPEVLENMSEMSITDWALNTWVYS